MSFLFNFYSMNIDRTVETMVSGDKLTWNDAASLEANIHESKITLNSKISDSKRGAKFNCDNAKDHFLATPFKYPELMKIKHHCFPEYTKY